MIEGLKIVCLCVLAAVIYGILHDQVTARVCLEYFTVFHPPIFGGTTDPTLLALGWGVIATWWVGLPLGVLLAISARLGGLPKFTARQIVKPLALTLIVLPVLAAVAGFTGYYLTRTGQLIPPEDVRRQFLRPEHIPFFMADAFAHLASYGFGALLGMVLSFGVIVARYRRQKWMHRA